MSTDEEMPINEITGRIIGCAYDVHNHLGSGFLEKVYENALAYDLRSTGLMVLQQQRINVWYKDQIVGDYIADMIVENKVMVELKAIKALDESHAAQAINYVTATKMPICLLINFGQSVKIKRFLRKTCDPYL